MSAPARVTVTVNGDEHALAPGDTVATLLDSLDIAPRGVAVAVEGEVVARSRWGDRALVDGERVEILSIAQGG